jgi:uncharacterized protein (TIGR03790 family)
VEEAIRSCNQPVERRLRRLILAALGLTAQAAHALGPQELGLIINDADPLSVQIGEYYRVHRQIPRENVVHVSAPVAAEMSPLQFATIKRKVDAGLLPRVQAIALAWGLPFRVGCMSVTSAFAFGYDPDMCAAGCGRTRYSSYYNSDSRAPYADYGIRPTMSLAAFTVDAARALIDRGVAADFSSPAGTAYLMSTSDEDRNVRAKSYSSARMLTGSRLQVEQLRGNLLWSRDKVMFYFTGLRRVLGIGSNHYLPGAIADHLTSSGGVLNGSRQMSAVRWLEAGATGSYGTVVEPCAHTAKFPSPPIVMRRYLAGETLMEAYWKSVAMPGQGLFIGEPLAAPFR